VGMMDFMLTSVLHEHPLGLTWTVEESMQRSSHALADAGKVWLVDPVDDPVALERAATLGDFAAVVQLLDRHNRDCAALAQRFGIPHLVNPSSIEGSPLRAIRAVDA